MACGGDAAVGLADVGDGRIEQRRLRQQAAECLALDRLLFVIGGFERRLGRLGQLGRVRADGTGGVGQFAVGDQRQLLARGRLGPLAAVSSLSARRPSTARPRASPRCRLRRRGLRASRAQSASRVPTAEAVTRAEPVGAAAPPKPRRRR